MPLVRIFGLVLLAIGIAMLGIGHSASVRIGRAAFSLPAEYGRRYPAAR